MISVTSRFSVPTLEIVISPGSESPIETLPKPKVFGSISILAWPIPFPDNDTAKIGKLGSLVSILNSPLTLPTSCIVGVKATVIG